MTQERERCWKCVKPGCPWVGNIVLKDEPHWNAHRYDWVEVADEHGTPLAADGDGGKMSDELKAKLRAPEPQDDTETIYHERWKRAAPPSTPGEGSDKHLHFGALRAANVARLPQFKNRKGEPAHSQPDGSDWCLAQWCNAVCGELGEAANLIKKIERGDMTLDEARGDLADELADIQTYLDILAFRAGINLGQATVKKWNEVSERVGCEIRLGERSESATIAQLREENNAMVIQHDQMRRILDEQQNALRDSRAKVVNLQKGRDDATAYAMRQVEELLARVRELEGAQ